MCQRRVDHRSVVRGQGSRIPARIRCGEFLPRALGRCHSEFMKVPLLAAALAAVCAIPCVAQNQDKGMWYAASQSSNTVTGDIVIKDGRLTINLRTFPLAAIRALTPAELSAVFAADASSGPVGNLYRLFVSSSVQFVHHNTLCGSDDTQWMVTYAQGKALQVAFFSGQEMPKLTFDAVNSGSANLCGTYIYTR